MKNELSYYSFISKISTTFLKNYDFDTAIKKSLKLLAKRTKANRSYIFLFSKNKKKMTNTHEYCQKGIASEIENLQYLDTSNIKWWMNELKNQRIINIPNIKKFPKEAKVEKDSLKNQGIKSIICFPFFRKKELIGFVGLDNIKDSKSWDKLSIEYLDIATKIIAKVFEKEKYKQKISEMNSTLQATLESSADAIVVIKKDGTILNHNENFIKMWNLTQEIRTKSNNVTLPTAKLTLITPTPDEFENRISTMLQDPVKSDLFIAYRKDSSIIEMTSRPLYVKDEHIGRVWKCTDITKQVRYEQRLQLISKVFEKSNDAIVLTDENINIIETNTAFKRITGYLDKDVIGKNPSILQSNWHNKEFYKAIWKKIDQNGYWEGEIWDRRKNGESYVNKTFISKIEHEGKVTNYIGITKDITQSKEYENKIKQLAFYDALTGLPNRTFFEQNLDNVIDECKRYDRRFAVLFLDLDNFKYVNDTFGHLIGDKLLQDVSNKLEKCVRKSDIVARIGGDEFTIIIKDLKDELDIDKIAKKIIKDISKKIVIEENELHVGTSIGICIYPQDATLSTELTKKADIAMYNSKHNGKNRYTFFNEQMNKDILERYKIEQAMRESIKKDHFSIKYQPFVSCKTNSINAVEALIRWKHPKLGNIMPNDFIHIAEENGMILKLGELVFQQVCKDIEEFERHNIKKVSINISPKQLMDINFTSMVASYIKEYDIDTSILEFEITEAVLMDDTDKIVNNLKVLRDMGITFALDDFGTGYSSLSYIKKFAIETIKIDKTFVNTMHDSKKDLAIVNTILYLSKELNKNIVAEGVETNKQLAHFKEHKKCHIQGYLFSKPVTIDKLKGVIKNLNS